MEVPYNYYILNVTLKNKSLGSVAAANLTPEQREMYDIYRKTQGNKPYLFEGNANVNRGEYTDYDIPPEALTDARFAAMSAEAEKYLGYPYVWGGSSPSTSFDCSGFACWVINQSGVGSVGRTTATGLFNYCSKIPPSEAKPGRLNLFHSTYDSAGRLAMSGFTLETADDTLRQPHKLCVGDFKILDGTFLCLRQIAITTMKGVFKNMKLDKIEREMQKTREKITEYQNRLKELEAQKTECENLQIVQLVRSLRLSPQELKTFLQDAAEQPNPAPVTATGYTTTEQEDNEDEE